MRLRPWEESRIADQQEPPRVSWRIAATWLVLGALSVVGSAGAAYVCAVSFIERASQ